MLSISSCAFWPPVCLLWRNVYLGLLPIFWLGWFWFWFLFWYWAVGIWGFEGSVVSMLISWFGGYVRDCPCFGKSTLDYLGMISIRSATCSEIVQKSLIRWEMVHSSEMVRSRDENERPEIRWLDSFTEIWESSNRRGKGLKTMSRFLLWASEREGLIARTTVSQAQQDVVGLSSVYTQCT